MAMRLKPTVTRQSLVLPARASVLPRAGAKLTPSAAQKVAIVGSVFTNKSSPVQDRLSTITQASFTFDEGITGKDDYSPLIAVVGFVAVWYNKLHLDRVKLLQALAILQLFTTAVNIVTQKGVGDGISRVVSPAVLAVAVLSIKHVTYLDAATGLFGYFLSENLERIFKVPYYVFLVILAAALYLGYGTLAYTIGFGIAAVGRLYRSSADNNPIPVIPIPALLAAVFAVWKEAHFPLALSVYLAQTVWSGLSAVDALTKRAQD